MVDFESIQNLERLLSRKRIRSRRCSAKLLSSLNLIAKDPRVPDLGRLTAVKSHWDESLPNWLFDPRLSFVATLHAYCLSLKSSWLLSLNCPLKRASKCSRMASRLTEHARAGCSEHVQVTIVDLLRPQGGIGKIRNPKFFGQKRKAGSLI
jgi:hypothetical protein